MLDRKVVQISPKNVNVDNYIIVSLQYVTLVVFLSYFFRNLKIGDLELAKDVPRCPYNGLIKVISTAQPISETDTEH